MRFIPISFTVAAIVVLATNGAQADFVVDARGGVEVWSVPQATPGPGFVATKIVLKTTDPSAKLVTFEKLGLPRRYGPDLALRGRL